MAALPYPAYKTRSPAELRDAGNSPSHDLFLMLQQPALTGHATAIAGHATVFADHPMAGNDDSNAVGTVSGRHGASGSGFIERFRQRLIMGAFPTGNLG